MANLDPLLDLIPDAPSDAAFLAPLADRLRDEGRWQELLGVRLTQARLAAGLPADAASIADADPQRRRQAEEDYAAACEEVGRGMLADALEGRGGWRQAWFYLHTAGRGDAMSDALRRLPAEVLEDEEQAEELIEVALHEGADPPLGYRWLIDRYGTCNAVTQLEGLGPHLSVEALAGCAAVLVERLHAELLQGVRAHIESHEGAAPPADAALPKLTADHPWLFAGEAAHVDASHLAAAVRMARVLESPDSVRLAWELADYGGRLHPSLHYGDTPPFDELYQSHRLFFAAQLGEEVEEAIAYFRPRAERARPEQDGLAPIETLLVLLARVGRGGEALRELGRLAPAEAVLSPYAPRPIDLARASGDWDAFDEVMAARGDVVAIAQGKLARNQP